MTTLHQAREAIRDNQRYVGAHNQPALYALYNLSVAVDGILDMLDKMEKELQIIKRSTGSVESRTR
jgi:hypothetical protein